MLDRIDHVGIACHDLAAKIAFYESVFDLTVVSREVNEEQGVREAMLRVGAVPGGSSWIQLLEPLAQFNAAYSPSTGECGAFQLPAH